MSNQDRRLLENCVDDDVSRLFADVRCEHPLDTNIIEQLKTLRNEIPEESNDFEIFQHRMIVDKLWSALLEKAIKCLRYYDDREPFKGSDGKKTPLAYGINELKNYYNRYIEFERILYGSSPYYRDHVIHVFRTWLSGIELLTKNGGEFLEKIAIREKELAPELKPAEKISIWTLIALTHDLGYPLEKSRDIISITQKMVATFVASPDVSFDFSFHGVQNYMNDFVVRLMSSKMKRYAWDDKKGQLYVARLQPKYYFKFQKSLEKNNHGILSTLIIYKLLTYFLESDYNINEDYTFTGEECRQFYIRREILRAIASHTCNDVYQLYMESFSFLLRICDDTQEWGRKKISELYIKSGVEYELEDIDLIFDSEIAPEKKEDKCIIKEKIIVQEKDVQSVATLIRRFRNQAQEYITIFRDGQDTAIRDFSFTRCLSIICGKISFLLTLSIAKDEASHLTGNIQFTSTGTKNKQFSEVFFTSNNIPCCDLCFLDADSKVTDSNKASNWRTASFNMPLAD